MNTLVSALGIFLVTCTSVFAQGGGLGGGGFGGGGGGAAYSATNGPTYRSQTASANHSQLIAVSGSATVSVKPEALRLVFAVTAEEGTSKDCAATVKAMISEISKGVAKIGVAGDDVVEDFIVVEQKYKWELAKVKIKIEYDKENGEEVDEDDLAKLVRELPDGFRMQTNLHVLCKDEQQALKVMGVAFKAGVNDIISFDYWHSDIDRYKKEALKKAVVEAKAKAEILLDVLETKPKVLNVSSSAKISYPESLYVTLKNDEKDPRAALPYGWRDYARIRANRPKLTFYAGSKDYADLSSERPAMNPEIAVSSTVTLTYGSPARDETLELERLAIESRAASGE